MKKIDNTEKWNDREWAGAAAWLSGEENGSGEDARILAGEEEDIMKKWNDLKFTGTEPIDVDKAWAKLNGRIEAAEKPSIPLTSRRTPFLTTFARIAAMVLIVAGAGWLLFEVAAPQKITVTTAADQKNVEVLLADGSTVFLNRNSSLTYPKNFRSGTRRVSLRGEAFFDIARDAEHPFIIDAGKANIRVLGTSFNVITENASSEVEVYVATGKVLVTSEDGSDSLTLEPEFVGRISGSNAVQARNTNVNYLAWHTEMLIYDGERLGVVFEDLKRAYNIEIKVADPEISEYRLTSPFEQQPQDTIVKLICTTFNLRSVREGDTYILFR
jgi:ferric-dicitrate binding protein FerR (iron transport regulator)